MNKYQVQFPNSTLTLPSHLWLRDFLVRHKGVQKAHFIMSMVESGKAYQDAEFKIVMIKENLYGQGNTD